MAFFFLIFTILTIAFNGFSCYGGGCGSFSPEFLSTTVVWLVHFLVTYSSIKQLHTIEGVFTRALNIIALLPSILFIIGTSFLVQAVAFSVFVKWW